MRIRKIMCSVLSAALLLGSFSATVYADEPEVITGTYTFTSEEGSNIQLTDDLASFVRDNKDSELVQKMVSMITTAVPVT